jgi:hypothetical protein
MKSSQRSRYAGQFRGIRGEPTEWLLLALLARADEVIE